MRNKYAIVFACLKAINSLPGDINLTYQQAVKDYTGGRTESLGDLSAAELKGLEKRLQAMSPKQSDRSKLDNTRKAIIAQFKSIGKTADDAISWAEKYGVNGKKKRFNEYTGQELYKLLQNAKKVKAHGEKTTINGLQQGE